MGERFLVSAPYKAESSRVRVVSLFLNADIHLSPFLTLNGNIKYLATAAAVTQSKTILHVLHKKYPEDISNIYHSLYHRNIGLEDLFDELVLR